MIGELAGQARLPLLGDGVVDGGRAEQQGAAHADGEHQGRAGRREAPRGGAQVRRREEAADRREPRERRARAPRRRRAPRSVRGSRPPPRGRAPSSPTSPRPCPGRRWWSRRRTAAPRRRARAARRSRGPGPSSRGSTAASVSAWVGGTRAARRPAARTASSAAATPPPTAAAIGSQPALTVRFGGAMPWRTSPSASSRPRIDPGPDPRRRAHQADDRRLPRDHAADLAGRRGHRAQERDLALALLDRQAHRAGHDEDRDEQRQPAERRGDGDQRGPRLLELGILGLAARVAGEHHRAAGGGAQARGVEAGAGEHADRVDAARDDRPGAPPRRR